MKIHTDIKISWNKAWNINTLYNLWCNIPETHIISLQDFPCIDTHVQDSSKKYIIRPSFVSEDSRNKSFAGKFTSIGPISFEELSKISTLSPDEVLDMFHGKWEEIWNIIVQEFIEGDYYWVFFTKNPNNFLLRWNYEIWKHHDSITWSKDTSQDKLPKKLEKELYRLWNKIEIFQKYPQDIEFSIKWEKIIFLQTRDITSWDISVPKYNTLKKVSGIYQNIDNGEFPNVKYLSGSFLSNFLRILYIWSEIYGKQTTSPITQKKELVSFSKKYKQYLTRKIICWNIEKIIFWQKLDKQVLNNIFKNYNYSFDVFTPSYICDQNIYSQKTNLKTRIFLYKEKYKNSAFSELERIKQLILEKNTLWADIRYLTVDEFYNKKIDPYNIIQQRKNISPETYIHQKNIVVWKWNIIFSRKNTSWEKWIYKWKIPEYIVTKETFQKWIPWQTLIIDSLWENISDYVDDVAGIIAKSGSVYSHNAILLREYKIPSVIQNSWK